MASERDVLDRIEAAPERSFTVPTAALVNEARRRRGTQRAFVILGVIAVAFAAFALPIRGGGTTVAGSRCSKPTATRSSV